MTLDGWLIVKHICAGLVPGVNLKTRPRAARLFAEHEITERLFMIKMAMIQVSSNPGKEHDDIYDYGFPFASKNKQEEENIERMFNTLAYLKNKSGNKE